MGDGGVERGDEERGWGEERERWWRGEMGREGGEGREERGRWWRGEMGREGGEGRGGDGGEGRWGEMVERGEGEMVERGEGESGKIRPRGEGLKDVDVAYTGHILYGSR